MNRKICLLYFIVFLFLFAFNLNAVDEDAVKKLRQNFVTADINMKQEILEALYLNKSKAYSVIYLDALNYIQNYYDLLGNDKKLLYIGSLAINKLEELDEKEAIPSIRYLFSTIENEEFQIVCLKALSNLIEKSESFTGYLNTLYEEGLSDLLNGRKFNINLLIAYSNALGKFASPSSFDVLFKTLLYPIDNTLKLAVEDALKNIFFDYSGEILERMEQNDLEYIYTLYSLACENKQIDSQKLAKISEVVLSFALENFNYNSIMAEKLILQTLPAFSKLKWSNVAKQINDFFYIAQGEWKKGSFSDANLIKVIDCMGNIGTLETAQNLSIFLGLINSQTELKNKYDEALVLSVIHSLGKLGCKTAFDDLLFVEYLDYSEKIKLAARQAIKDLKW